MIKFHIDWNGVQTTMRIMKPTAGSLAAALAIGVIAMSGAAADEQRPVMSAVDSTPETLGWMEGFPPSGWNDRGSEGHPALAP